VTQTEFCVAALFLKEEEKIPKQCEVIVDVTPYLPTLTTVENIVTLGNGQ